MLKQDLRPLRTLTTLTTLMALTTKATKARMGLFCAARLVFFGVAPHAGHFVAAKGVGHAEQHICRTAVENLAERVGGVMLGRAGLVPAEYVVGGETQVEAARKHGVAQG